LNSRTYTRGNAIKVEVGFELNEAYKGEKRFDPTSPVVTVTSAAGNDEVSEAALTKNGKGRYSYIIQTLDAWETGDYSVTIKATHGSYTGKKKISKYFELV